MPKVTVRLKISADEILRYYKGEASEVRATATDGRSVSFPARVIRPFVTKDGINGSFDIYFDEQGKFTNIRKVDEYI